MRKDQERIALIDMDGTIADHDAGVAQFYDDMRDPNDPYDWASITRQYGRDDVPDYLWARVDAIRRQEGWWRNLPRMDLGFEIVDVLREFDFDFHIATKAPSSNPFAWTQKVEWARENFPEADIHITDKKSLLYGKLLVDDFPDFAEEWIKHRKRGMVIMPAHDINQRFDDIEDVYMETDIQIVRYHPNNQDALRYRLERLLK